jgi:hypothetical protein
VVLSRTTVAVFLVAMVAAALGIGLMGAVGSASPKDNDDDGYNNGDEGGNLTVLTKTSEIKVVDLGPQGQSHGDMRITNAPLYNATGKERIGRLDLFVVVTDPANESAEKAHMVEAMYTYTLPGGEISAQGAGALPTLTELTPRQVDAITGGTGKYAGVRGEVRIERRGNKVISTFHFID